MKKKYSFLSNTKIKKSQNTRLKSLINNNGKTQISLMFSTTYLKIWNKVVAKNMIEK